MDSAPTIGRITRSNGVAGQYSLTAEVTYPDEPMSTVTFVGNAAGGPIVLILPSGNQAFVSRDVTDRIGSTLNDEWIRRFIA